jgi:hypothetical protein
MADKSADIENKLLSLGLSRDVVRAAWPKWWSAEAELSPSALNDLKFSLSRKLGISPSSLFDEGDAVFVWKGAAKFKGLAAHTDAEQQILASFGQALAKPLLRCFDASTAADVTSISPEDLRRALLEQGAPAIDQRYLIRILAVLGIPVVYLRVMPLNAKRMAAMSVRVGDRFAILLAKEASYFAPVLFNVAHELGHIARSHLAENSTLIDGEIEDADDTDREEQEATAYALTLLTGRASPIFDVNRPATNATQLAAAVRITARDEHIDPGLLAMVYGYSTRQWKIAYGALKIIYGNGRPVWEEINRSTLSALRLDRLTEDNRDFLLSVLGLPDHV